eukprot:scaffold1954_cov268-Pinguiococcus_pyrenoidosus.AAC.179
MRSQFYGSGDLIGLLGPRSDTIIVRIARGTRASENGAQRPSKKQPKVGLLFSAAWTGALHFSAAFRVGRRSRQRRSRGPWTGDPARRGLAVVRESTGWVSFKTTAKTRPIPHWSHGKTSAGRCSSA